MPSSPEINQFNERLRSSDLYQTWMRSQGIDPSRPVKLSDRQRKDFQRYLEAQGAVFPKGAEIDPAGNMNENEGFAKQAKKWGPLVGGAALMAFGIPGTAFHGLLGGSSAAAAGGSSVSHLLPGATTATAAATGAGLSNWLAPALFAGIPAAANLFGAKMAMSAADRAAQIQAQSYQAGLDELKRQYDVEREDFRPYREAGAESVARMGDLLKDYPVSTYTPVPIRDFTPRYSQPQQAVSAPTSGGSMADVTRPPIDVSQRPEGVAGVPGGNTERVPPGAAVSLDMPSGRMSVDPRLIASGGAPRTGLVMMQAPTGERKAVPVDRVAQFERMGARRV